MLELVLEILSILEERKLLTPEAVIIVTLQRNISDNALMTISFAQLLRNKVRASFQSEGTR